MSDPNGTGELSLAEADAGLPASRDGKGIGDIVDSATIDAWAADFLKGAIEATAMAAAFRFGVGAETRYAGRSFIEAEAEVRSEWSSEKGRGPWDNIRDAVWAGFERARERRM